MTPVTGPTRRELDRARRDTLNRHARRARAAGLVAFLALSPLWAAAFAIDNRVVTAVVGLITLIALVWGEISVPDEGRSWRSGWSRRHSAAWNELRAKQQRYREQRHRSEPTRPTSRRRSDE